MTLAEIYREYNKKLVATSIDKVLLSRKIEEQKLCVEQFVGTSEQHAAYKKDSDKLIEEYKNHLSRLSKEKKEDAYCKMKNDVFLYHGCGNLDINNLAWSHLRQKGLDVDSIQYFGDLVDVLTEAYDLGKSSMK